MRDDDQLKKKKNSGPFLHSSKDEIKLSPGAIL